MPPPKLLRRWKFIHAKLAFISGYKIMLNKCLPIRAVRKINIEDYGILNRLLQTIAWCFLIILRLNDRKRRINVRITELVVGLVPPSSALAIASVYKDLSVREKVIFARNVFQIPACVNQGWGDIPQLCILFVQSTHYYYSNPNNSHAS